MAALEHIGNKNCQLLPQCDFCEEIDTVEWKCVDCDLVLCSSCNDKVHSKIKSANEHIVNSYGVDNGKDRSEMCRLKTILCKVHAGNKICLYCKNCETVVCPTCVSESHTKHHLDGLEEIYKEKVKMLQFIRDELQADLNKFKDDDNKLEEQFMIQKRKYDETKEEIEQNAIKLKRAVDEETQMLLEKLAKNWIDVENANKIEKSTNLLVQGNIRSKISKTDLALNGNDVETVIISEKQLLSDWGHKERTEENFFNRSVMEYLPGTNNLQIGTLQIRDPPNPQFDIDLLFSHETDLGAITKLHACKDEHVFVCDQHFKDHIDKIILKEPNFDIQQEIENVRVFDLVETEEREIIVSFVGETRLKIVQPNGELTDFMDFSPWMPRALHISKSGKLLVSGREPGYTFIVTEHSDRKIIAMDVKSKTYMHRYEFDEEHTRLFSFAYQIKTMKNNDLVIIDRTGQTEEGSVVSVRFPNVKMWNYDRQYGPETDRPFSPTAIETTETGCVIITDLNSHLLHIVDINGYLLTYVDLEEKDIFFPYSLTFDLQKHLWIGCCTDDVQPKAMIHVVKLSGI